MSDEQSRAGDSKLQNNLSAKGREDEKSSGIPRWLKTAAVVVPLIATLLGGIWKFAEWYKDFKTTIEKERTKQTTDKLAMEKEVTARLQISTVQEITLQKLRTEEQQRRTEEQQSKGQISQQEIEQRKNELRLKQMSDEANRERLEAAEVTSNISKLSEPPSVAQEGLTRLVRYAANPLYRDFIVIALSEKFKKIRTFQEAQLAIKLVRAIKPEDFNLIADANRVAMQYVEENYRAEFWHSFAPHINKMEPSDFLERRMTPSWFYSTRSFFFRSLKYETQYRIAQVAAELDIYGKEKREEIIARILKDLPSPDMVLFEAYCFILRQSAEMLVDFIETHKDEPLQLDISNCCFSREPNISSTSKIKFKGLPVSWVF